MIYATSPTVAYEVEGAFSVQAGRGSVIQFVSGAVAGNRARLNQSVTQLCIDSTKALVAVLRAAMNQTVNVDWFIGFFSALPTAANPPVEPSDGIYFRRKDVGAAANWFAVTRKGGVETAVDTTVLGDTAQHDFKIISDGTNVQFFIDNILRANTSTNVPIVALLGGFVVVTVEGVAKSINIDTLFYNNKR